MVQKALIYCRVSDKSQVLQGSGLTSQEHRCRQYAMEKGYDVDAVFPDDITGGGDFMKRPGMVAMLGYLKAQKGTPYVIIFDDIKRFARDAKFHLILKDQLTALNHRIECPNFTFDNTPEGRFYETVVAAGGELERQQNARQVRQKIIARFEAGYWGTKAPLGYKMQTDRNKPRILIRHEPIASYIQEVLEGFACGRFETQAEAVRFLETCPEFPRTQGKGVHEDKVRRFLTNSVYAGMVEMPTWGVGLRKGQHEGLIPLTTFQKNQERLFGKPKAPVRKDLNLDFPLRGAVCCADCGWAYTACWSKGRNKHYPYYLCSHHDCESYGKSIKRETLEGAFDTLLTKMTPSKEIISMAGNMFKTQWSAMDEYQIEHKKLLKEQIKTLDVQKESTVNKLIDTNISSVAEACEQRIQKMEIEKGVLAEKIANCGRSAGDYTGNFRTALAFLANPRELWSSPNYEHKRAVLRMGYTESLVYKRGGGFRTASKSSPFRLLDDLSACNSRMVDDTGLEPVTPAL